MHVVDDVLNVPEGLLKSSYICMNTCQIFDVISGFLFTHATQNLMCCKQRFQVTICIRSLLNVYRREQPAIKESGGSSWNLTPSPLVQKMAAIMAENDRIPIQISLKFVSDCPIDNDQSFVSIMAWRRTGDKPLSVPMRNRFTDAYMRH